MDAQSNNKTGPTSLCHQGELVIDRLTRRMNKTSNTITLNIDMVTHNEMDEYVEPNDQPDKQEEHGEHESYQSNDNNNNLNPPKNENNDASQEHYM